MTTQSESIKDIPAVYGAICGVVKDLSEKGIGKNKKNLQQNYSFRGVDDVMNALAPLLPKHGLVILPRVTGREVVERINKNQTALFYITVTVEFDFVAVADGSKHTVITMGEAMDSGDKATNKAMSAAYKYACFQTFCVPTEAVDPDAESHEVESTPKPAPRPQSVSSGAGIQAGAPVDTGAPSPAALKVKINRALGQLKMTMPQFQTAYGFDFASSEDAGQLANALNDLTNKLIKAG